MRLRKFRIRAYRCIHDSGEINVGDLAAFVGRNESGKTTILQALTLLNKDEVVSELDLCDEMSEELKSEIKLVEGEFELNQDEIIMIKEKRFFRLLCTLICFVCCNDYPLPWGRSLLVGNQIALSVPLLFPF